SDATRAAYLHDVEAFVDWAGGRAGLPGPEAVTRLVLRRYLAFLTTLGRARRVIARAASGLRRYFGRVPRTGARVVDLAGRRSTPSRAISIGGEAGSSRSTRRPTPCS